MRRPSPFFSPIGFVLTLLLFLGLGFSLWRDRGLAFSPGAVTSKSLPGVQIGGYTSHAEFEKRCVLCHEPLRATLAEKCILCHTAIAEQITNNQGIHGRMPAVTRCQGCHPEHRGRDFDPTQAAYRLFDHDLTGFSLIWHGFDYDAKPLDCAACHQSADYGRVEDTICASCHGGYDSEYIQAHTRDFGENCLGCHDGYDRMMGFDHATTGFILEGQHRFVVCTGCHTEGRLLGTPRSCVECHAEPQVHLGLFDLLCEDCHTAQGWKPAWLDGRPFEHALNTGFSLALHALDYEGFPMTCVSCHPNGLLGFDTAVCTSCHGRQNAVFMQEHLAQFSSACMDCHDGVDRLSNFDHAQVFILDGRHAELACTECHADQVFRGTPTECWQCHPEPEIHAGFFGLECAYCHTTVAWLPAELHTHVFPLDHGAEKDQTAGKCLTCHPLNYLEYTCYGCHEHQQAEIEAKHLEEGISLADLPKCVRCHPSGQEAEED